MSEQPGIVEKIRPMMDRQVRHMVRLIDDLRDVSRIETGNISLQRQPVLLATLVGNVVEANRSAISATGLTIEVLLENSSRLLDVDPTRLSQAIGNILHNAIKFTPAGGSITVSAREERSQDPPDPHLVLRIVDIGIGIDEEQLPGIFGLFSQIHAGSSARYGGLGIGLALARRLVELHGGTLTADSAGPGRGTGFPVRIPAVSRGALAAVTSTVFSRLDGQRILIVDDNVDAADSMALFVSQLGAEVRVTYDGVSALKLLDEFDASLVLLDIGMPEIDGYQTWQRIRRQKGEMLRVAAVTGWGQQEERRRASHAGFDAHLTKPVHPQQLVQPAAAVPLRLS